MVEGVVFAVHLGADEADVDLGGDAVHELEEIGEGRGEAVFLSCGLEVLEGGGEFLEVCGFFWGDAEEVHGEVVLKDGGDAGAAFAELDGDVGDVGLLWCAAGFEEGFVGAGGGGEEVGGVDETAGVGGALLYGAGLLGGEGDAVIAGLGGADFGAGGGGEAGNADVPEVVYDGACACPELGEGELFVGVWGGCAGGGAGGGYFLEE